MSALSPAPVRPSPAVHGRLEQLRDAEGHGAHEVVSGGPVPVPHLHAEPAFHVPRLQVAEGRAGRSEGPARGSPTSASWMLEEPANLLSWGPFPALQNVFPPLVLPKRVPLPAWAQSQPSRLSQSPPWPSASLPLGFSLRISPILPPEPSFCLSLSWLLFLFLPPTYHTPPHAVCVSPWVYVSFSESEGLPNLSDLCLSSKTVTFCVSIPLPQSLHFLRPPPSSPCAGLLLS